MARNPLGVGGSPIGGKYDPKKHLYDSSKVGASSGASPGEQWGGAHLPSVGMQTGGPGGAADLPKGVGMQTGGPGGAATGSGPPSIAAMQPLAPPPPPSPLPQAQTKVQAQRVATALPQIHPEAPSPPPMPSASMEGINMATGFGGSGAGGSSSSGGAALNLPLPRQLKRLGQRMPPDELSPLAGIARMY